MSDDIIGKTPGIPPADMGLTREHADNRHEHREQMKEPEAPPDEVKDHIGELSLLVERVNLKLQQQQSRLRLELNTEGDDLFIDIIRDDGDDKRVTIARKNITHENLIQAVEHIISEEGFIVDRRG